VFLMFVSLIKTNSWTREYSSCPKVVMSGRDKAKASADSDERKVDVTWGILMPLESSWLLLEERGSRGSATADPGVRANSRLLWVASRRAVQGFEDAEIWL
jgi:hypothetical protein